MHNILPRYFLPILLILFSVVSCSREEKVPGIGVLQWTEEVKPYSQTYAGILDGLKDQGFQDGVNLKVHYVNSDQNKEAALENAKSFVGDGVKLIVALGTGSAVAALEATETSGTPIVFSIVGAPKATGIIRSYEISGRNITGVSMKIPVTEQFSRIQTILPAARRMGVLYCSEMVQAVITGEEAAAAATRFGWSATVRSLGLAELGQLEETVRELVTKVDFIYLPTDPILGSPRHLQTILGVTDSSGIPVVGVAKEFVERGVLAALHCDYYESGRQTAGSIAKVLNGVDVSQIPSQHPIVTELSINLNKAQQLNIPINRNVILRADNIID